MVPTDDPHPIASQHQTNRLNPFHQEHKLKVQVRTLVANAFQTKLVVVTITALVYSVFAE